MSLVTIREFIHASIDDFSFVEKCYRDAITIKSESKAKNAPQLLELDRWYQEELPLVLQSRIPKPYFLHEDLVKLMKWKLARGHFRPNLLKLITNNSPGIVEQRTADGILMARTDLEKGLEILGTLKGVGPATASAILAAALPSTCGFFADEVAEAFLNTVRYTAKEYLLLNDQLLTCAKRLNASIASTQSSGEIWGAHKVELVMWTYSVLRASRPEILRCGLPSLQSESGTDSVDGEESLESSCQSLAGNLDGSRTTKQRSCDVSIGRAQKRQRKNSR